jgi:hypothetical protein
MKFLLSIFLILFLSVHAQAQSKEFLKCLAQEELQFHKQKVGGAYYKLNQKLISELIQMTKTLTLKEKYQEQICNAPKKLVSLTLLKLMMIHKEDLFISYAPKGDLSMRSVDNQTKTEIVHESMKAFIHFINHLQAQTEKPNCLITKNKELYNLYLKARYTLEDQGLRQLINEVKDLEAIFDFISNRKNLLNC